jgi:1-acyl-sn-glycerol-3-phosphate acyltransferase
MKQETLLQSRRFGPLFWTQFLGAFNDNLFKNAIVVLLAFRVASVSSKEAADVWVNLAAGVFILPFFLFSATAGQLADKFDKARLIRWVKAAEIGVMSLGAVAFFVDSSPLLLVVLFLMGVQSSVFGPVKYSILPQHLRDDELVSGNGLIEMGTFVAILVGTIAGGLVMGIEGWGPGLISAGILLVAVAGFAASKRIPSAPSSVPELRLDRNPVTPTWRMMKFARKDKSVFLSILGISWFWFYGALFLAQFPGYARDVLGGDETVITVLLAAFSIGIGVGSMLCNRLSGKAIEIGLVPLGALGLSVFAAALVLITPAAPAVGLGAAELLTSWPHLAVLGSLVAIGVSGGLYIVPLYALVQHRSEPSERSRVMAANNILNALFMVGSAGLAIGMRALGFETMHILATAAVLNLIVAAYIFTVVPEFILRFVVWMLMHTVYRLRSTGLERIPEKGAVVLAANHVSFIDAFIVAAAVRRPVRFVMDHRIYETPVLHWLFRVANVIPIAPKHEDRERLERAMQETRLALEAGDVVCIFPEGKITRDGEMNEFKAGIERIIGDTPVPVVPIALRGLWGSFFSRKHGSAMKRPFARGLRNRIELRVGDMMPASDVTAARVQAEVASLSSAVGPGHDEDELAREAAIQ